MTATRVCTRIDRGGAVQLHSSTVLQLQGRKVLTLWPCFAFWRTPASGVVNVHGGEKLTPAVRPVWSEGSYVCCAQTSILLNFDCSTVTCICATSRNKIEMVHCKGHCNLNFLAMCSTMWSVQHILFSVTGPTQVEIVPVKLLLKTAAWLFTPGVIAKSLHFEFGFKSTAHCV